MTLTQNTQTDLTECHPELVEGSFQCSKIQDPSTSSAVAPSAQDDKNRGARAEESAFPPDMASHNDRHTPMLKLANEIGKSQLLENKRNRQAQWTPEKRARQAKIINDNQPWRCSSGPKTAAGKAASRQNAWKHGAYCADMKELRRLFRRQKRFVDMVNLIMRQKNRALEEIRATTAGMTSLEDIYRQITERFAEAFEEPKREAKYLIRDVAGLEEADFISAPDKALTQPQQQAIQEAVKRRVAGEPLTRILGCCEFWGLEFEVTPETLDPRPDTETLVEAALKWVRAQNSLVETPFLKRGLCNDLPDSIGPASSAGLQHRKDKAPLNPPRLNPPRLNPPRQRGGSDGKEQGGRNLKILDLGTGTGCIAIALLSELPNASAVAVDISHEAALVARRNAAKHGMSERLAVIQGDWLGAFKADYFDLIVANPPYIPNPDIENLAIEVKNHDPILSLSGGKDGLDCYKKIIFGLKKHLNHTNRAFLEIGIGQLDEVSRLVDDSGLCLCDSEVDMLRIPRVVEISRGDK